MNKRKICVITSTRADYGLLFWLMKEIEDDSDLDLQIIATGAHLSPEFGLTYRVIEGDGFVINEKVDMLLSGDTKAAISKSLGLATMGFADAFNRLDPDLVVLLGDRYETLAAAQAALIARIPIAHIAGGDSTEGAFDEAIRHSITKMAHLHFVTNELSARRVKQLGENPKHVYNVGSPGIDYIKRISLLSRSEVEQATGFEFRDKNLLVTFHPVTLDASSSVQQFAEVLNALDRLGNHVGIILTKANADTEGRTINQMIDEFAKTHPTAKAFVSLGQLRYLSAISQVDAVVGNSSSGLYEAPSFCKPTVNIGDRQKGRLQAASVINCEPEASAITEAVKMAFTMDCSGVENPYGDGNSSKRILSVLKTMPDYTALLKKSFFMTDNIGISNNKQIFIIAEAGVNHNGSLAMALKLIDIAADAGADAVKFQTFKAEKVISRFAAKAEYQTHNTDKSESQLEMVKKLELNEKEHWLLAEHCQKRGIEFMSTPFDLDSLDFLANVIDVGRIKIPSGEITNALLLLKAAQTGKPIVLSTGMSTLDEVEIALGILAFGFTCPGQIPSRQAFRNAYTSSDGQQSLREKVVLLHCTTEYPAPFDEINLKAIDTLKERFDLPVGYSDHTMGIAVPIAAAARGSVMIEKHFTLDRSLPGPDHKASLEPDELKQLVTSIRQIELSLGTGIKGPTSSEIKNKAVARKSLVAARNIVRGELFTEENLGVKRPGTGISPIAYWDYLGKSATKDYEPDEVIEP
ncbi:MAG: N-acetylneuraminate synthase [Deltaproteobacteria bacterium]